MTATVPEWVQAQGYWNVYWLPEVANLQAITTAEFTAGVDITCYLPDPQWDGIAGEQEKFEQTRACLQETFEVLGRIKRSIEDLTYTVMPQDDPDGEGNKVATLLAEGSRGVVVIRRGKLASLPIATADKYSAIRAKAGMQKENLGGADAGAPTTNTSSFSADGQLVKGVVAA